MTISRSYFFPLILLTSLLLGGIYGYFFSAQALLLKPLGDIFLNLLFTVVVPLVFFSVSAAFSKMGAWEKLGRIFSSMTIVFLWTGIVAASLTILMVTFFPIGQGVDLSSTMVEKAPHLNIADQLVAIFTVSDFLKLFSHKNMLALIIFSILVGIAASTTREKNRVFAVFLQAGEDIFMRVFSLIMYVAPIGFFAYFATLVGELGPKIMENYVRVAVMYYTFSIGYFILIYSFYSYLTKGLLGFKLFWKNISIPAITAIATCSSAASIPANLEAAKKIGVSPTIYETALPIGTLIHKEGSIIGGIIKIAFLFGVYHMDFSGITVLLTALGVSLLVGTVMGAIPSGGMLGELLILSVYGFPPSALMIIAVISLIIDPMATMLNVTGNSVSNMMIARLVDGKNWIVKHYAHHCNSE